MSLTFIDTRPTGVSIHAAQEYTNLSANVYSKKKRKRPGWIDNRTSIDSIYNSPASHLLFPEFCFLFPFRNRFSWLLNREEDKHRMPWKAFFSWLFPIVSSCAMTLLHFFFLVSSLIPTTLSIEFVGLNNSLHDYKGEEKKNPLAHGISHANGILTSSLFTTSILITFFPFILYFWLTTADLDVCVNCVGRTFKVFIIIYPSSSFCLVSVTSECAWNHVITTIIIERRWGWFSVVHRCIKWPWSCAQLRALWDGTIDSKCHVLGGGGRREEKNRL